MPTNRRELLRNLAGIGVVGACDAWRPADLLHRLRAADRTGPADLVPLEPDLEPLVRRIEETPREKCFEMITAELHGGLTYRRFLAALFLAGVRNVNPWPPGFDLHCVFVIHAANQLSLDAAPHERLLPLYWALDEFKNAQASDAKKNGDYRMVPIGSRLPSPEQAWKEFHAAMEAWDAPRAERAVVALVRTRPPGEIIEALWRYGARDFRNIGHKAIYVANAWRTLQAIGWRHAEPVLRSLIVGLLDFGTDQRVNEYVFEDQAFPSNQRRVRESFEKMPAEWAVGAGDERATLDLLTTLRAGDVDAACRTAFEALAKGRATAQSLWDAIHLAAGEQMMRQPGIVGLHTVTSVNGLHYAYETTTVGATRLLLLLQAVGWLCQFHHAQIARKEQRFDVDLANLEAADLPSRSDEAVAAIFAAKLKPDAAKLAVAYGRQGLDPEAFAAAARSYIFAKVTEPHGYKYPVAVFEDYRLVSPRWRPQMLATAVYHLPSASTADSKVMQAAREAVRSLG
jgi:hypothetical protein